MSTGFGVSRVQVSVVRVQDSVVRVWMRIHVHGLGHSDTKLIAKPILRRNLAQLTWHCTVCSGSGCDSYVHGVGHSDTKLHCEAHFTTQHAQLTRDSPGSGSWSGVQVQGSRVEMSSVEGSGSRGPGSRCPGLRVQGPGSRGPGSMCAGLRAGTGAGTWMLSVLMTGDVVGDGDGGRDVVVRSGRRRGRG